MRRARVRVKGVDAGILEQLDNDGYRFTYDENYQGAPVSLTMPVKEKMFEYKKFPPFFEGVLPEGDMLEAMLRKCKIDRNDYFGQLVQLGGDLVGSVTVEELK